eukprot:272706-Amphidinium_carterae.1
MSTVDAYPPVATKKLSHKKVQFRPPGGGATFAHSPTLWVWRDFSPKKCHSSKKVLLTEVPSTALQVVMVRSDDILASFRQSDALFCFGLAS